MLSYIEQQVEGLSQIIEFDTWLTIVLNSFNDQKFLFLDSVY